MSQSCYTPGIMGEKGMSGFPVLCIAHSKYEYCSSTIWQLETPLIRSYDLPLKLGVMVQSLREEASHCSVQILKNIPVPITEAHVLLILVMKTFYAAAFSISYW